MAKFPFFSMSIRNIKRSKLRSIMLLAVVALTVETNPDIVDEIIEGLDLRYSVLYGLPEFPLSSLPNTHVLMRGEDGTWKVLSKGSWIGFVETETIIQFIVDNTTE